MGLGEVIVITSGKGGVGKTTTTANIGTALAMSDQRVVMVDADIGLRNLDVVLGLENRIVYDLVDVVDGFCRMQQALIRDKRLEGLFLLPAAQTKDKTAVSPDQMRTIVKELSRDFDYVLVDSPAGIEQGFKNAVAGADQGIIITTPEVSAVRDADRIIGLLEADEMYEPYLIVNRLRPEMVRRGDMMDVGDIVDILAIGLLGVVPEDESIVVSTNRGEPVVHDSHAQSSEAYRNMARRLLGEEVPLMSLQDDRGFLQRIRSIFTG
jgi:septum site-determining protein MinD